MYGLQSSGMGACFPDKTHRRRPRGRGLQALEDKSGSIYVEMALPNDKGQSW